MIFLFSLVLQFTGYDASLEVQNSSAQNGIKYVMAFTCIIFMILGFIMAKKYVLSKERNAKVQKYLALSREGRIDTLSEEEREEYLELRKTLS